MNRRIVNTILAIFVALGLLVFYFSTNIEAQSTYYPNCSAVGCSANSSLGVCVGPGGCVVRATCYSTEFDAGYGYCCVKCDADCGTCGDCALTCPDSTWQLASNSCATTAANSCTRKWSVNVCGNCGTKTGTCWRVQRTVIYDANGGTCTPTSRVVCYDTTSVAPSCSRTGYSISSFSRTSGSGGTLNSATGAVTNVTGDQTITANWAINTYTVSYAGNGGTCTPTSRTVNYDAAAAAPSCTRTGYHTTSFSITSGACYGTFTASTGACSSVREAITIQPNWALSNQAPTAPTELRTEGATNPTTVTDTTPEFRAKFTDPDTGNTGLYYQIQVNTNSSFTGTVMWDSGQTSLPAVAIGAYNSPDISYAGTPLTLNGNTYYWRIRYTDNDGAVGAWSTETASFTMNTTPSSPSGLQAEAQTNPIGVTDLTPEFSAIFNDSDTGDTANYYEIEVNTNSSFTGTVMWDSGQTSMTALAIGSRSPDISYAGSTLTLNGTTYYWRIRFTDSHGTVGAWSSTANFTMNTPPSAPTSLLTEGVSNPTRVTDVTPEFSAIYNDANGSDTATKYDIEVNTNSSFTGIMVWSASDISMTAVSNGARTSDISYAGTALTLNGTTYYWRIRFTDNYGTKGAWSSTANFRMNTPPNVPGSLQAEGQTNPTGITDITPEFTALHTDPDTDSATHYQIQVNTNSSFTGISMWDSAQIAMSTTANSNRTPDITYNGTTLTLDGTTYYWRMRVWDSSGTASGWSNTATFKMNTTPDLPYQIQTNGLENPTALQDLTPEFSAIFNDSDTEDTATHYEIEVNINNTFSGTVMWDSNKTVFNTPVTNGSRSEQIQYQGIPLEQNGQTFYWRIRFWDSNDTPSAWSSTASFRMLDIPDAATNLTAVALSTTSIRWEFEDNATGEEGVMLYDETDTLQKICIGENLTFCVEEDLDENTQYTRYAVIYNSEAESQPSNSDSIYTLISTPTLLFSGVKTDTSITLTSSQPANSGELYFDCIEGCGDNINVWTLDNNPTVSGLQNNTPYTFRVKARNGDNIESAYSSSTMIYTHAPIPTISAGALSTTSISLSASGVNNLSTGDSGLFFECTGTNCNSGIQEWITTISDVVIGLEPNTQYTFRAKARNFDAQESAYSTEITKYTLADIPSLTDVHSTSSSQISLRILNGLNPSNTEFLVQETVTGKYVNLTTGELQPTEDWQLNGTPITISGLNSGTTYTFKVKARNGENIESDFSSSASATTLLAPITALTPQVDSSSQITWKISEPPDSILGIKLYDNEENLLKTCLGNEITQCTESSLLPNTTYTRKLKVYNSIAESEFTNSISATTYANIASFESITTQSYTSESILLKVNVNGNPLNTTYLILEENTNRYFNSDLDILQNDPYYSTYTQLGTSEGATVYGLSPNSVYSFKIKALNSDSVETSYSSALTFTTLAAQPSVVSVNAVDSGSVKVLISNGGNHSLTQFRLIETKSNLNVNSGTKVLDTNALWKSYQDFGSSSGIVISNLQPNTQYSFCVKAKNSENLETGCSQIVSAYTYAKSASLSTRVVNSSSIEVSVNKNSNPTNTRYQIVDVLTNGNIDNDGKFTSSETLHSDSRVSSNFLITNLPPNTTYSFRVRSVNTDNLYSSWSESISATTWANTPKDLLFEIVGGSSARLKFDRNGNSSSTRYAIQESNSGKYVDYTTSKLVDNVVWGTYTSWGSTNGLLITSLDPGSQYSFRIKAINSANVETNFVEGNTGKTYSIILNKPESITTVLADNTVVDVSNIDGAQTGEQNVRILKDEYIVADIPISFEQNRDWSNVVIETSILEGKTVIKLDDSHGLTDKFTMYVTKNEQDNSFRICPQAKTLEEVNRNCPDSVLYTGTFPKKLKVEGGDVTVSQAAISGVTYWIADGITGTGGQGEYIEEKKLIPTTNFVSRISQSVEGVVTTAMDRLESSALGNIPQENLTTVSATATAVTVTVGLASLLSGIGQVGYGISQVFINIFSTLGFRRKRHNAGYIYDSITRAPIQQAIIRIYDSSKKLVDTSVTDGYGYFRTSVPSGEYILDIKKREYSFPSSLILGKEDYPLTNIYHGEKIHIKEGDTNIVVPLDPEREVSTKRIATIFRSLFSSLLPILNIVLFVGGVLVALYVYQRDTNLVNLLILLLYIPTTFVVLKNIFNLRKRYGKVEYLDGKPAVNITLHLKEKDFDKVVSKRVTDSKGRYSFDILEKGEYVIESADTGIKIIEGETNILSKKRESVYNKLIVEKV